MIIDEVWDRLQNMSWGARLVLPTRRDQAPGPEGWLPVLDEIAGRLVADLDAWLLSLPLGLLESYPEAPTTESVLRLVGAER